MDKTSKKFKMWRSIGLVALTIAVIGVVVLTVFLTQKAERNNVTMVKSIGETFVVNEKCQFKVTDIVFDANAIVAGKSLEAGQCLAKIKVEVNALSKVTIKAADFKVDDKKPNACDFGKKITLDANNSKIVEVDFVVAHNTNQSLFLIMFGCKIPLGSTLVVEGIK